MMSPCHPNSSTMAFSPPFMPRPDFGLGNLLTQQAAAAAPYGFPPGFPGLGPTNSFSTPSGYPGLFPRLPGFFGSGLGRPPPAEDQNVKDDPKVNLEHKELWP